MKKHLLIYFCLTVFSVFLTGCSTNTKYEEIKIVPDHNSDTYISGMGVDYQIENIKKDKYEIEFYAKEYKKGKFVNQHRLYNLTLDIDSKNKKVPVSVYEEDKDIKLFIDSTCQNITLDFFEEWGRGLALSGIESEKVLKLNEDTPIAVYSIAGEDRIVSSVNLEGDYELGSNEQDLVIFMKITQSN